MPWVGLLCVIVVFPDQTHSFFYADIRREIFLIRTWMVYSRDGGHSILKLVGS